MSRLALKAIQAAAGNAGEAVYVDDLFSTYLYEGTGASQTINNGIKLGNNLAGPSARFNNTSDYLNGTLSGGSNTKTITFSGWFYKPTNNTNSPFAIFDNSGNLRFYFNLDGGTGDTFQFRGYNSSGTQIFRVTSNTTALAANNWYHIMLSIDLANSSNRHLYLNDVAVSSPNWSAYTNDNIALSEQDTFVGTFDSSQTGNVQTYMSNIYLDYTYRDLSVESNRRLFITSDDTPATGQASLNPILYLPLDSASLGSNSGTGGDLSTVGSPYYDEDFGPYIGTDGEGGMVWIKSRGSATFGDHRIYDTERGATYSLASNQTWDNTQLTTGLTSFNSAGFTHGSQDRGNQSGIDYVSWTFRKQPGFFDIVTYTGNGTAGRTVSHNLGSVPGMIIVKRLNSTGEWAVYHSGSSANPEQNYLWLNTSDLVRSSIAYWNDTAPTDSEFSVGTNYQVNSSGSEYVAYLFAHNDGDGEFGEDGDQDIIKCGSYTGNGSATGPEIDLGFEPQWLLIKRTNGTQFWNLIDVMRGMPTEGAGNDSRLYPNESLAESTSGNYVAPTPTGFKIINSSTQVNGNGSPYIYVAIRRPHKPAEEFAATDLFALDQGGDGLVPAFNSGFPIDWAWENQNVTTTSNTGFFTRILGDTNRLVPSSTGAEISGNTGRDMDYMDGWVSGSRTSNGYSWMFRRAPGFFDVVAYTGTGSNMTIPHNLGVTPELFILKKRNLTRSWVVYSKSIDIDEYLTLNTTAAAATFALWQSTAPTATQFTVGTDGSVNGSGDTFVVYLFATVPGISKVGSYTGTGSDVDVDCGFTSGARFVLVKRTDSTGDWYLYDSERGIVAGNDPYLLLNVNDAQVTNTDYIDPLSSGFTITSSAPAALNNSGGTYIFLAIA